MYQWTYKVQKHKNTRTDGGKEGQMDGQKCGQTDRPTDGWRDRKTYGKKDGQMDKQTDRPTDQPTDRWMDQHTNGLKCGPTDQHWMVNQFIGQWVCWLDIGGMVSWLVGWSDSHKEVPKVSLLDRRMVRKNDRQTDQQRDGLTDD